MLFDHTNVSKRVMWGGNVLLFIFLLVLMVDPSDKVLHLKGIAFVSFVAYNAAFLKPDFTFLPSLLMPFIAVVCGLLSSQILGVPIDADFAIATCKAFFTLILLLWVRYYNFLRVAKYTAIIFAFLAICIFLAAASNKLIRAGLWTFQEQHEHCFDLANRSFLGVELFGISFNSTISTTLPLFAATYAFLTVKKHRFWNFLEMCLVTTLFIISCSRSTMMLPFVILSLAFYLRYKDSKYVKLMIYPIVLLIGVGLVVLIFKFASEKGETSNTIKFAHLYSYGKLFHYNPEYFILGQGAGSYFFTFGFRRMVTLTEWNYLEILRICGLFSVGIFYILIYPFYYLKGFLKDKFTFGITVSYFVFLLVAGTNPMLIGSSGMSVMLMIYCFMSRFYKTNNTTHIRTT